jgi:hypothetical protein
VLLKTLVLYYPNKRPWLSLTAAVSGLKVDNLSTDYLTVWLSSENRALEDFAELLGLSDF